MKPDFFKNLPPEIISEILLRLPVVSIPISKCVCKRWLHLLESDDFIKSHFARSAPALVVVGDSGRLKVFELESELELDLESHDPLTKYDFPYHRGKIKSSVNGLLVLMKCVYDGVKVSLNMLYVCNPITREVIKLNVPSDSQLSTSKVSAFGFGASRITGRYKMVCVKLKPYDDKLDCHVYTLGTGSWRRLEECFSFFKAPPYHAQGLPFIRERSVSALSGCLWFSEESTKYENDGRQCELVIWIMKEYGVDESWSKEYVIPLDDDTRFVVPIKVFKNGDLLMLETVYFPGRLFYYSNKNKTMQRIDLFGAGKASDCVECGLFTPTLVSLKALGLGVENVISF
ncbi:F-box protein CPR1-like isoform X1 [Salvia miltiorrhiza]|uniref:F-box protein CPR1-like isoform X1 n=1 Tax=Salvia miltiorrhiza TaxID=226208 RepID=UPI0025ACC719|nr:F-box protein CPR1-like isoform X1 [Salvia miltiorrhiza]